MATDTRKVQFDFVAKDNLSPAMQQMARHSDGLSGKLSNLSTKMGGKLASVAKGGALAFGAMAGSAIVFGVKTAASMEQAQVAFTTMLGSADKAKSMLADLQKFAAATPFELPQLTKASQQLLAYGFNAKQVIPTLTAIGDAAAGLGGGADTIDHLTMSIGQMTAKGKVQSDEILQLTEAGVPALKILANQYHVTTSAMQQMITDGVVKSSDAVPKLLKGIEEGTKGAAGQTTKFAGMMKAQSGTLSGLFSTLKDNVSQALGNMVTPFLPALKSGLGWLVDVTGKLQAGFQGKVIPALKEFGALFQKGFKSGNMDQAATTGEKIGAAFRKVADFTKQHVVPALKDLWTWTETKLAPSLQKYVKNWLPGVRDAFKTVSSSIHDNRGELKTLGEWLGKIVNVLVTKVIPVLGKNTADALRGVALLISLVIKYVGFWVDTMKKFGQFFTAVLTGLTRGFLAFAGHLVHGAAVAFGWIPGIGGKLKTADKQFKQFAANVNATLNSLRNKDVYIQVHAQGLWTTAHDPGRRIPGLAAGGAVPKLWEGATRGADSQPAMLRVDEHVWTPEEVDAVGGHGAMYRMRKAARKGLLQGFASGGAVGLHPHIIVPSAASVRSGVWSPIKSGWEEMFKKLAAQMAADWKKYIQSAGGVVAAARSQIGLPYSWGGGGIGGPSYGIGRGSGTYGFDCSGLTQYAWWKGRHVDIGGSTGPQAAGSRSIGSPRPGALGFVGSPIHHVMLASDRPGMVIQAPFTGSYVQEVPRSSSNWRWPNNAGFYDGGPVGQLGRRALLPAASLMTQKLAKAAQIIGRAGGGSVSAGNPYLVGEYGAEIHVPRTHGTLLRSGSTVVQQNIVVNVKVGPTTDIAKVGKAINEALFAYKKSGGRLVTA